MSEFTFESGIEIPATRFGGRDGAEPVERYPVADMEIGQSFVIPIPRPDGMSDDDYKKHVSKTAKLLINRVNSQGRAYMRTCAKYRAEHGPDSCEAPKFVTRTMGTYLTTSGAGDAVVRVWKIEDTDGDAEGATEAAQAPAAPQPAPPAPPPPPPAAPAPAAPVAPAPAPSAPKPAAPKPAAKKR